MAQWLQSNAYAYPALEALHIVGIALLLGALVVVELRLLGLGAGLPLRPLARLGLGVSLAGFALAAAAGLLMFASQAAELLANDAFKVKLALIALAGINAAWFHGRDGLRRADTVARAQAALSLVLWLAVVACGRWIAYV